MDSAPCRTVKVRVSVEILGSLNHFTQTTAALHQTQRVRTFPHVPYLRSCCSSSSSDTTPLCTCPVEKLAFSSALSKPPFASLFFFFFFFPKSRLKGWNLPCCLLSVGKTEEINSTGNSWKRTMDLRPSAADHTMSRTVPMLPCTLRARVKIMKCN